MFEVFDCDRMLEEQKQYGDEVKKRWGNTEAYKQPMTKTARCTKKNWELINEAQMQNIKELCSLYNAKAPHDDPRVQGVVERSRKFISDNFNQCPPEALSCLEQMYVTNERFTAYYEKFASGLAAYYNDAIQYYCTKSSFGPSCMV